MAALTGAVLGSSAMTGRPEHAVRGDPRPDEGFVRAERDANDVI
jgi:hypothetical protein